MQLLKREEVETLKISGQSIIAAVHASGTAFRRRAYVQAPFGLMYGFRGNASEVELLSPYEMLMPWSMEEVKPPSVPLKAWSMQEYAQHRERNLITQRACIT